MRVWQVIPSLQDGGTAVLVRMIHQGLLAAGLDNHVISFGPEPDPPSESTTFDLSRPYHPMNYLRLRRSLRQAKARGVAPDVIHAHLTPAHLTAALLPRQAQRPVRRGESTISQRAAAELRKRGRKVGLPYGDIVRTNRSKGLGFSKKDGDTNVRPSGPLNRKISPVGQLKPFAQRNALIA